MKPELSRLVKALTVEVIRLLWDQGLYRRNKWLQAIHENWFDVWVDWRTEIVMNSVDQQAEDLVDQWEQEDTSADPLFTEKLEGETPLGGEMRLKAPWQED